MQEQASRKLRTAERNGGRIYGGESSIDPPKTKAEKLQRRKFETVEVRQHNRDECGLRAEHSLIGIRPDNANNINNDRSGHRGHKRGHYEALAANKALVQQIREFNATQQVGPHSRGREQNQRTVLQQPNLEESNSDQQRRRRQRKYRQRRARRRPSSRRSCADHQPPTETITKSAVEAVTASNKPNYLVGLSKISLSAQSKATSNKSDSLLDDTTATSAKETQHENSESRQVVLEHYIKHNIEEGSASERCGCNFNRLRGLQRKGNLLSELEEFYRKFHSKKRATSDFSSSSSSGRLTARASELSIDASHANAPTAATHLEQTRNLKLQQSGARNGAGSPAVADHHATVLSGYNPGHGGLFIDESDAAPARGARGHPSESVAQLALACPTSSSSSGLLEQPLRANDNQRQPNNQGETEREYEGTTNDGDYFHCRCHLARINSPNSIAASGAGPATVDGYEELLIAQRKRQQQREQQEHRAQTTSESLLATSSSSPIVVSISEEDRQVSSLSWDKFDLFAPSQTPPITGEQRQQQTTTNSGGRLTPTASFCKGNTEASHVLLACRDSHTQGEFASEQDDELPFSLEEAASLLTDELAFSEAGSALESFVETSSSEESTSNNDNRALVGPKVCGCACNCCSEQRRRRQQQQQQGAKKATVNLSSWSISDNLVQQLKQLAGSDTSFGQRQPRRGRRLQQQRRRRPNCCCQKPGSPDPSQQRFGDFCSLTADNSTLSLSWPRDSSSPNDYDDDYDGDYDDIDDGQTSGHSENKDEAGNFKRIVIQPSATTQACSAPSEQLERRDLHFGRKSLDDVDYLFHSSSSETLAAPTAVTGRRRRLQESPRKGEGSQSCSDEKFKRFVLSGRRELPERSARSKRGRKRNSIRQSSTLEAIDFNRTSAIATTTTSGNNCYEKELASCKMGIDGASGIGSEPAVGSSTQRQPATNPTTTTEPADSARAVAQGDSQKLKQGFSPARGGSSSNNKQTEGGSDSSVADAGAGGPVGCGGGGSNEERPPSGLNNSEISRPRPVQEEEEDEEDASGYTSASESMKAVKDIAKMSIPSLSALQYLPGQLEMSGRPKAAMQAHAKQQQLPQQQQPQSSQQLRQPLSHLPSNFGQQQQQTQRQPATRAGSKVKVITESSGEDLQHDESCLIHRLCLCNCMSRQQHVAGLPDPSASSASQAHKKRKRSHVKRSKVKRSSAANATAAATSSAAGDIDSGASRGGVVERIVQDEKNQREVDDDEEENDSEEELSARSEGIKRRVAGSSEKQSPTFLGLLKSSAAAVHLTRRQPSNLVQQHRRSADLIMAKKLGSAGDLEASATGSASSSRNDSDLATTSGSLSYLRSRSTSFTTSEQRRAQSPTSNDYNSIAEDDCFDDSLSSGNPLRRSQSACGSHPPASASAEQEAGKKAGKRTKSAYKKLLSPSRLFSSRSPSPQPALLEHIAASSRSAAAAADNSGKQQEQHCDDGATRRQRSSDDTSPSFLTRSLIRLSGRKGSKKQEDAKQLETKVAATVGSDPNILASIGAAAAASSPGNLRNQPVSISHSNLSNIRQPDDRTSFDANDSSLNSSLVDEGTQAIVDQPTATLEKARQALVGQQQHQQRQGVNRLVARAPQARQTPQIVLSRAEFVAAQAGNNLNKAACDMARIKGYTARQEQPQHYHYGSGAHTASMSGQRYGSEISADLSTTSGENLSERALSLPASPRTGRRNYNQDRRQNPSPRLRESPVPFRSPPTESTKIEDGLEVCSMEHFEKHIGNIKDSQVEAQKYLFTTWINHFCPNLIQRDLVEELKDGIKLIGLIASLTKDTEMISHYERLARDKRAYINRIVVTPSSRLRHLSNVSIAIDHLREKVGMKLINLNPMDVVSGKPNVVLGLCWNIILHFQFEQNFLKHLETCEDSRVLLMEQTLKSWVSYEEARRRLKAWLATAEAKLCDALGPIIMMNSTEELAANRAIGISSASQSQCSLPTLNPISQHTDRLEDLIKYFELEEAEDPVLGASSDQLASLSRQSSNASAKNGQQPAAAAPISASSTPIRQPHQQAHQQPSSLENLKELLTPASNNNSCLPGADNQSISGSLMSLGSCSSRMSSLQSSKNATYRKLFDDFAGKCRILARMLGRDQRDALLFGVKELKARLKYITELRVPQVVSELRMSINRCEMSIKEQDERLANLSGADDDVQLELSTDPNGEDSNEATSDLEELKEEDEANEENSDDNDDDDDNDYDVESKRTSVDQQPSASSTVSASPALSTVAEKAHMSETRAALAAATSNLTSSSKTASSEASTAEVAAGEEKNTSEVVEQQVASKKDKNSSKNNTGKNSKNKRVVASQAATAAANRASNSQPVKTHAGQQHQNQQRGKQAAGAYKQDATALGTWSLLNWFFSSDPTDSSPKLVAKSDTNSNKKRKHMSSHKGGKSHKSRNKNSPSKQQVSSKVAKDGAQTNLDTDDPQSISYTRAVWHKVVRAYRTSLSLNIILLICLAGICVVPLVHREACCDPAQPSQILPEDALTMNERPT